MKSRRRSTPAHRDRAYSQLWRVVDGAVADAFACHPDYLTSKGHRNARASVAKRVTGHVLGFAAQAARVAPAAQPVAPGARQAAEMMRSCLEERIGVASNVRRMAASLSDRWGRLFSWGAP